MLFFHILNLIGIIFIGISLFTFSLLYCLLGILIVLLSTNSTIHKSIGSDDIFSPLFIYTVAFIISCRLEAIFYFTLKTTFFEGGNG